MEWNISAKDFVSLYKYHGRKMVILDVRELYEYEQYHLPGSLLIPLDELYCKVKELDPNVTIYVICEHGIRSIQATFVLYDLGFSSVYNVMGGFEKIMKNTDIRLAKSS